MGNSSGKPVVLTDEVSLNHFRLLRVVGKGAFGKVRIVERKDTGLTFALKYIRKDEIVRSESVRNIIRERRMLEQLQHPFLCNLRYSFQDIEYLYIVVDLMQGGDLRFHISRKTFTEEAVGFWVAELACALRYIHRKGIVHRDLKPDNVLLDSEGHVHLADFNVASDFSPKKPLTSKSGTLAYLAPEVYLGRGYSCEVDWWSLGVTFYECIYNKRPFESGNHESLAQKIIKANPPFPTTNPPVSKPCLHAISSLLEKDVRRRIGAAGFHTFTDNPFFRQLDFDALERKRIPPIFVPSPEKTNFDATYDLEELLLEEAPLEARARRQKPRSALKDDATQEEIRAEQLHQMIESMFLPFNYTLTSAEDDAKADLSIPTDVDPSVAAELSESSKARPVAASAPRTNYKPPGHSYSYSRSKQSTRSRGTAESSPSRAVAIGSRSSNQSPNGSPPPSPSVGTPEFASQSPIEDPHALPIQHYDSPPPNVFPTLSDAEEQLRQHSRHRSQSVWASRKQSKPQPQYYDPDQEREMAREIDKEILMELEQGDQERSRGSPPLLNPKYESSPGMSGFYGEPPTSGGAGIALGFPELPKHLQGGKYGKDRVSELAGSGKDRRNHQQPNTSAPQQQRQYRSKGGASAAVSPSRGEDPHQDNTWNGVQSPGGAVLPTFASVSRSATAPGLNSLPSPASEEGGAEERMGMSKPTGVLGFLGRRRGRDRSPRSESRDRGDRARDGRSGDESSRKATGKKGKEKERGVIGKEGARVVVANG